MPLLPAADGAIEYLVTGSGEPVTVFAHGLSSSVEETRPLASGVTGTRVFFHFRGHGATTVPLTTWTYDDLGSDLRAVSDHVGARRALGASLGAGAVLNVLAATPERYDRVVLFLPAVLDTIPDDAPFDRIDRMADAIDAGNADALAEMLLADQPPAVRAMPQAIDYWRARARSLVGTPVSHAVRTLPRSVPVRDRAVLRHVTAPVLVVAQAEDTVHLASVAEGIAEALPNATLHTFPESGTLWHSRNELRELIAGFLNEE
jgi:pimeloyl-ACP methyl ester carboxylesterase